MRRALAPRSLLGPFYDSRDLLISQFQFRLEDFDIRLGFDALFSLRIFTGRVFISLFVAGGQPLNVFSFQGL